MFKYSIEISDNLINLHVDKFKKVIDLFINIEK